MPRIDRTGPLGEGPMTGRAAGPCADYGAPGFGTPAWGGHGRGAWSRGGRREWRHWRRVAGRARWARRPWLTPFASSAPEDESAVLQAEAKWLHDRLESIRSQLADLATDGQLEE